MRWRPRRISARPARRSTSHCTACCGRKARQTAPYACKAVRRPPPFFPADPVILLATGAKELGAFAGLEKGRLYARVLPTHEGIDACAALGLAHSHILAMQGPFTQKLNEAMLEQYGIRWLVTKDGGRQGGFAEKLAAARNAGAALVLISRPAQQGQTMEEILKAL